MTHPPIHRVSIRLCEQCLAIGPWCETPGCALNLYAVGPLDTSPALAAFYTDPATGLDTRTNDTGRKEP